MYRKAYRFTSFYNKQLIFLINSTHPSSAYIGIFNNALKLLLSYLFSIAELIHSWLIPNFIGRIMQVIHFLPYSLSLFLSFSGQSIFLSVSHLSRNVWKKFSTIFLLALIVVFFSVKDKGDKFFLFVIVIPVSDDFYFPASSFFFNSSPDVYNFL